MLRAEKPLGRILSFVLDQLVLNFLFLLCCLPVVTIGGAAISLYEQEYAIWEARDTNLALSYLKGVLHNFLKGLAMMGICIVMVVAGLGMWASFILMGLPIKLTAAVLVCLLAGIFSWFLGLTGRYVQKIGITFRNAYILTLQKLPVTLALVLINLGYPALILVLPEALLSGYLFLLLFFFFAAAAWLSTGLLLRALKSMEE